MIKAQVSKNPCPQPKCLVECEHGERIEKEAYQDCPECHCIQCRLGQCDKQCRWGYVEDVNRCIDPACVCKPPPVSA